MINGWVAHHSTHHHRISLRAGFCQSQLQRDAILVILALNYLIGLICCILVAVSADGEIWMDGKPVDIRAVRAGVERMRVDQPDSTVVVQADRDARTGLVVRVMDQIRLAGVSDVALAATAGQ